MKRCLACGNVYPSSTPSCSSCGAIADKQDGFVAYAPALAKEGPGFKSAYFADLDDLEAGHFWFRARNRLIIWALGKYCPEFRSFLEIGCGTGYVLAGIAEAYPSAQLHGGELFTDGLHFAAAKQPTIDFMQMDARHIPFVDEYDAIGAFDVLEHIIEDELVLMRMREALRPQGIILLTVPQHTWLWSSVDEYSCHVRRYGAKAIREKIEGAGFKVLRRTSFVSIALPAMIASRLMKRRTPATQMNAAAELKIAPWLNHLLERILDAEIAVIRSGVNWPVGGSLLIVAKKI